MKPTATVNDQGDLLVETGAEIPLELSLERWERESRHGVFDTGRYRLPYFTWGQGPPLVFIHGLCDISRSFVPVMDHLRSSFTCIAYDLPDGGSDGAKLGAYKHEDLVADLLQLLDYLNCREVNLFASSFGSTIALRSMAGFGRRFRRAVLQGGFAHRPLRIWEHAVCAFARYLPGQMATLPLRDAMSHHPRDVEAFKVAPPKMWQFLVENGGQPRKSAVARRGLMIPSIDLRDKLSQIRQPVLMICGDRDPIVPAKWETPLVSGLPNVERVEIPICGHFPQYTHPALIAELVRQFLQAPECLTEGCPH